MNTYYIVSTCSCVFVSVRHRINLKGKCLTLKVILLICSLSHSGQLGRKCSPLVKRLLKLSGCAIQHLRLGQQIRLDFSCLGAL